MWKNVSYYYFHRRKGRNWFKIEETTNTSSIWRFLTMSKWIIHSVCQKYPVLLSYSGTESTNSEAVIAPCSIQLVWFSFWARGRALFPGAHWVWEEGNHVQSPLRWLVRSTPLSGIPRLSMNGRSARARGQPRGRPAAKHMLLSTGRRNEEMCFY